MSTHSVPGCSASSNPLQKSLYTSQRAPGNRSKYAVKHGTIWEQKYKDKTQLISDHKEVLYCTTSEWHKMMDWIYCVSKKMSKGTLNTLGTRVAPMNFSGALLLKHCVLMCWVSYSACPSELYLTFLWIIAQPSLFCHFLYSEQAIRGESTGVWYHTVLCSPTVLSLLCPPFK